MAVSFPTSAGSIATQINTMLSYFTHQHLLAYGRSHLWVNPEGETADPQIGQPGFDTVAERVAWIKNGRWRYAMLSDDQKKQQVGFLDRLQKAADGISRADIEEDLRAALEDGEANMPLCQYLELLVEYLIWDLFMNIVRYHKVRRNPLRLYVQSPSVAKEIINAVHRSCLLAIEPGTLYPMPELSKRMRNLLCILAIYLQEAQYIGLEQKKERGEWALELLRQLGSENITPTTSLDIPSMLQHSQKSWFEGLSGLTLQT